MKRISILLLITTVIFNCKGEAQNLNDVQIETIQLSERIYMLKGAGGNIGVSVGEDGVFVIDDQFAPLTPKILDAISKLSDKKVKFVANTHWHGDHTGGNENLAKEDATIMAHQNVRKRLAESPTRSGDMRPKEALPIITFEDKMSLYINGEQAALIHVNNAHTDGDAVIYFTESNVVHTGDTFFHPYYPYIDMGSGGSVDGYIAAVESTLMLIDDETVIIPGHGNKATKADYKNWLESLKDLRSIIQAEINNGKSEEEVVSNTALTKKYDDLGYGTFFITGERARRTFYQSLKN